MKNYKLLLKLSVFTSILMLAGCGQKGPLYLESEQPQKVAQEAVEVDTAEAISEQTNEQASESAE